MLGKPPAERNHGMSKSHDRRDPTSLPGEARHAKKPLQLVKMAK